MIRVVEAIQMTLPISIAMQKGGVGKTTTAINLSGALAEKGQNVLLVDADPQGYATKSLGFEDEYLVDSTTLYDIFLDANNFDQVNDLVIDQGEFDLLPSHLRMFKLERELHFERRAEKRLSLILDELNSDYDYIIMDSPPNLGPLTDNTIIAAEHVLFPAHAHEASKDALEMLFDEIESIESEFDIQIVTMGAVVNMTTRDNVNDEMLDWFDTHFGEDHVYEIPDRAALRRAWKEGVSIFRYNGKRHEEKPTKELRERYTALANHVEGYA